MPKGRKRAEEEGGLRKQSERGWRTKVEGGERAAQTEREGGGRG